MSMTARHSLYVRLVSAGVCVLVVVALLPVEAPGVGYAVAIKSRLFWTKS